MKRKDFQWEVSQLINLVEFIHEKLMETNHGKELISYIEQNTDKNVLEYINDILSEFFDNDDPNKVISYTRNRKLMRRKVNWYEKATTGYRDYLNTGKVKRGIYRHIVDYLHELEMIQKEKGPILFKKMINAPTPEKAVDRILTELDDWANSDDSLLIHYPFFESFGDKLKEKSVEVDGIIIIGEAFIETTRIHQSLITESDGEMDHVPLDGETYFKKMPSIFLDVPFSGIVERTKYELNHQESLDVVDGELVQVKKKFKHELPEGYQMFVDKDTLEKIHHKNGGVIKTPDMFDEMLFIEMLEHRDSDFQKNKRIFVYLSDLIEEFYTSDSVKSYQNLRERLWSLGHFRIAKTYDNGGFKIRSLFNSMSVDQDETGRWYVRGIVSDEIRDAILRDNFVKIYNEKINELQSPLAMHLSFLIQKERILHHQKNKDMITFQLGWADFIGTIRMNKRSKRENMKEIASALAEIKDKKFLLHSYYRIDSSTFIVNCYNLNDHELKDRASIRSIFKRTTPSKLLEGEIGSK